MEYFRFLGASALGAGFNFPSACWASAAGIYATALLLGSWNNFLGAYASKLKGAGFDFQVLAGHMLLVYMLQRCYWARGIVFWVPLLQRVLDSTSKCACWARAGIYAYATALLRTGLME